MDYLPLIHNFIYEHSCNICMQRSQQVSDINQLFLGLSCRPPASKRNGKTLIFKLV